jgi:hypothetical protein
MKTGLPVVETVAGCAQTCSQVLPAPRLTPAAGQAGCAHSCSQVGTAVTLTPAAGAAGCAQSCSQTGGATSDAPAAGAPFAQSAIQVGVAWTLTGPLTALLKISPVGRGRGIRRDRM